MKTSWSVFSVCYWLRLFPPPPPLSLLRPPLPAEELEELLLELEFDPPELLDPYEPELDAWLEPEELEDPESE